jgi:hypothetical protein
MKKTYQVIIFSFIFFQLSCKKSNSQDESGIKTIQVNWSLEQQILGLSGINFEGYHINGGSEIMAPKFESMLATLPTGIARLGLPLKVWEPENDNADPGSFQIENFKDEQGVHNTFLRMQELQKRGIKIWLSVWDMGNWNITDPSKNAARRIANFDEMAESIGTFILQGKEQYQVEPLYISVNEPTIASENGWGGYQIALSTEEQISLISKAGAWFELHGLKTKWIIALHKVYPSELAQAKEIFANIDVKKYATAFDFHAYHMEQPEFIPYLKAWGEWVESTGLPAICGECDYDNHFWDNSDRESWVKSSTNTGILINRLYKLGRASSILPWYANAADATRPYRFVMKHFMESFKPGWILVNSDSPDNNILVTAAKKDGTFVIHLQNISATEKTIRIENIPTTTWAWICSKEGSYYQTLSPPVIKNGALEVTLPANSLNTFTGKGL